MNQITEAVIKRGPAKYIVKLQSYGRLEVDGELFTRHLPLPSGTAEGSPRTLVQHTLRTRDGNELVFNDNEIHAVRASDGGLLMLVIKEGYLTQDYIQDANLGIILE